MSDDVVAVLVKAKGRVAAGWWHGDIPMAENGACAYLALVGDMETTAQAALYLEAAIYGWSPRTKYVRAVGPAIWGWQDRPERTLTEVLDAFEKAIMLAKETGR